MHVGYLRGTKATSGAHCLGRKASPDEGDHIKQGNHFVCMLCSIPNGCADEALLLSGCILTDMKAPWMLSKGSCLRYGNCCLMLGHKQPEEISDVRHE